MTTPSPFSDAASLPVERDPAGALAAAERALANRADSSPSIALELVRGAALLGLGRYRDAALWLESLEEQGADPVQRGTRQIYLSEALWVLGRHDEARALGESARELFGEGGDELGMAWVDVTLANIHHHTLDATGVQQLFDRARATLARLGAEIHAARADVSGANALTYQAQHGAALARYQRAREVFQRLEIPRRAAISDLNRAILHQMRGELQAAVRAGEDARAVFQHHGQRTYAAFCETNLSEVLLDLNRDAEALEVAGAAAQHYAAEGMHYDRAIVSINLARALQRTGSLEKAREVLVEAGAFFAKEGSKIYQGLAEIDLAVLDLLEGEAEQARERAASARVNLARYAPYAAYSMLVEARAMEGVEPQGALALYRQAIEHGETHDLDWLQYRARHRASILLAAAGQLDAARAEADASVRLIETARAALAGDLAKTAFVRDKEEAFHSAVRLHLRAADNTAAFRAVEAAKSAALVELLAARLAGGDAALHLSGAAKAVWEEFEQVRGDYAAQVSSVAAAAELEAREEEGGAEAPLLAAARRTHDLARRYDSLRDRLVELGRQDLLALSKGEAVEAATVASWLRKDERFLQLFILDGRVIALLVSPGGVVEAADCGAAERLTEMVVEEWHADVADLAALDPEARQRLLPSFLESAFDTLDALGEAILAPFATHIHEARRLIISPHGILHALPFPALRLGGQALIEYLEPVLVPSGSVLAWLRSRLPAAAGLQSLVLAVPDPDAPEMGSEGSAVAGLLSDVMLLEGDQATVQAFREHAPRAKLLHIASHGEFTGDNPLASSLLLADGPLRAVDLYGISLTAPLVVLSGCETGRSRVRPGDELIGLLRGFFFAGVQVVVASLWRVDDAASALLMEAFYSELVAGTPTASALRKAQQKLAREFPHPFLWAGFCAFGQGDVCL